MQAGLEVCAGAKVSVTTVVLRCACMEGSAEGSGWKIVFLCGQDWGVKAPVCSETPGEGASVCFAFALGSAGWEMMLVRWGRTPGSDVEDLCALTPIAAGCDFPDLVVLSDLPFPNPLSFVGVLV